MLFETIVSISDNEGSVRSRIRTLSDKFRTFIASLIAATANHFTPPSIAVFTAHSIP